MGLETLTLSLGQLLALIGLVQSFYVLVYITFRAGQLNRAAIAVLFFMWLSCTFILDFAEPYYTPYWKYYDDTISALWFFGPALSILLMLQVQSITRWPGRPYFLLLFIPFIAAFITYALKPVIDYSDMSQWFHLIGLVLSAFALSVIWLQKESLHGVLAYKFGRERYWAIIAVLFTNIAFLTLTLMMVSNLLSMDEYSLSRTVLGLLLAYLAGTSLFRLYPQAIRHRAGDNKAQTLNDEELDKALEIERLLNLEKLYQEPGYSRSDLAKEVGLSESVISKIVNLHFEKTVPQLLNEMRVQEAERYLKTTDFAVKEIAEMSGFNSLATFNRVFKEVTGRTPADVRNS